MRISGFVISGWIHSSGIPVKPKKARYSQEQEKRALEMYIEGESYPKIKSATDIPPHRLNELAKQKKVKRKDNHLLADLLFIQKKLKRLVWIC